MRTGRRARGSRKWTWGTAFLFLLVYLAGWMFMIYTMSDGYRTFRQLDARREALKQEKARLRELLDQVQTAATMRSADSPFFVEMVAREKLKMASKGEVIIRLQDGEGASDDPKAND